MPAGRGAGRGGSVSYSNNYYDGKSYVGINEEIMWVSIGMGILILVLIALALLYILRENLQKRREERAYYVTA